ncbi:hypothetical protein [Lusitaniella coriacea]|uniref:hypothetical protein n=1 Tax=Lusitaniella coriacea TaxID=1983105 RepID=UPI003CE9D16E
MESSLPLTQNPENCATEPSPRPPLNLQPLLAQLPVEAQALCALYILEGQFVLRYRQDGQTHTQFVGCEAVRAAFNQIPIDSGFLQPGIVRWGTRDRGTFLVRFLPPQRRVALFLAKGDPSPLPIQVPLTPLVFLGIDRAYFLWAVKTARFDPEAPAFLAPFPNISGSTICFGSNRVSPASARTLDATWQLFLNSPFNGDSAAGKSRQFPDDARQHLLALHAAKKTRYPLRDLVPLTRCGRSPVAIGDAISDILH